VEAYREGDVVRGKVTKVVTFGAFVEILPGVEGLVHISELAAHHVENPREVVAQGQDVNVRVLEIDAERRRLSLSLKRVEEGAVPKPRPGEQPDETHLELSEEVFSETPVAAEQTEGPLVEDTADAPEAAPFEELPPVAEELSPEAQVADAPAPEAAPAADEAPAAEEAPAEDAPAAEEAPAEDEPVAAEEALVEDEPVAAEETAVEADAAAEADDEPAEERPITERDLHRTGF
jgi:small subunit ribosomal protein S1